ncbi:MAG: hypothetical protein KJO91_08515, partial [Gammaproteobacteria bacterium]|nr:hypothetical protein [Gammaproteobacteria bacterium]
LCWLVTLLGAEFTYCLSVYRYQKSDDNWQGDKLLDVLQILSRLWRAQQRGEALSLEQLTEELKTASEEQIENLLIRMQLSGLVLNTMKYEWALGRDLSHLTLAQLFDMRSLLLPTTDEINSYDGEAAASIRPLLGKVSESSAGIMQIPLDELFSGKP